jgi:N6-L-threonylcarbamoyladenine synthase/protein kinase Bud32
LFYDKFVIAIGIESSADKLGVGIITDTGEILANERITYRPPFGEGIHPREASESHAKNLPRLIQTALAKSQLSKDQIDLVAFTQGQGMGPCLRIGAVAARTLSINWNKPLIGVNHQVAHVEIGRQIGDILDPVVLYVSGGNTQVIAYSENRYRVFGETLDIPIGNCLDTFGRECGIDAENIPMGLKIEQLAAQSTNYIPLPYIVKGMDVSFSGIATSAIKKVKEGAKIEDMCFSLQETAFAMLVEVVERALSHTHKKEILACGGVASNNRLKEMLKAMSDEHGAKFVGLPAATAIDNGVMIAWTGILNHKYGLTTSLERSQVDQHWRIEDCEVPWKEE